ncbi:MAG: hypothetical protein ACFFDI_22945 [Promethearchaeota archaeon]
MIRIEAIMINGLRSTLTHYSSTETKVIKLNKKTFVQDALKYIEQYLNETGFELLNVVNDPTAGMMYNLIKK